MVTTTDMKEIELPSFVLYIIVDKGRVKGLGIHKHVSDKICSERHDLFMAKKKLSKKKQIPDRRVSDV